MIKTNRTHLKTNRKKRKEKKEKKANRIPSQTTKFIHFS